MELIQIFNDSFWNFKKDIMNMGRLLSPEFRRTNLPPYDRCLASNKRAFFKSFFYLVPLKLLVAIYDA
jgi:hypothetical protein